MEKEKWSRRKALRYIRENRSEFDRILGDTIDSLPSELTAVNIPDADAMTYAAMCTAAVMLSETENGSSLTANPDDLYRIAKDLIEAS